MEKTGKMEKTAAEDAVKLLKDILEIPSVNGKDDEGAVAEYLDQYFKSYGIESRVDRIDETHANVIALIPGESGETEIWNGHLDTVPYGDLDKWETEPWKVEEREGKLFARGASRHEERPGGPGLRPGSSARKAEAYHSVYGNLRRGEGRSGSQTDCGGKPDGGFQIYADREPTDLRPGPPRRDACGCACL